MIRTLLATVLLAPLLVAQDAATDEGGTNDTTQAFLEEAEAILYHPDEEGLQSFSFSVERPAQQGGGTIRVAWTRGEEPQVEAELGEQMKAQYPEAMLGMVEEQLAVEGREYAKWMLNRPFSMMQGEWNARIEGVEDGLMKVAFEPTGPGAAGSQAMLFDDEQVLEEARMSGQMNGQQMDVDIDFDWRPVAEGDGRLVLSGQTSSIELPSPMGEGTMEITSTSTYHYTNVDDLVILTGKTDESSFPPGGQPTEMRFENLVVNGEPVGG